MSEAAPLLSGRQLCFAAGGRMLVSDASLDLEPGATTILIGPNGAGKSTLLKLLTGELAPAAGSVHCADEALGTVPAWRLACLRAVMAQHSRLAFPFSVYEVARLGVDGIGRALTRQRREAIVAEALAAAGVLDLAGRRYQTLSGGEQQRVQFARVLCQLEAGRSVAERQVLFLDEPIASLDLCHQLALLDMARSIAGRGVAVLIVLHDLNLAVTYADHLVVMDRGRIIAQGPPAETLDDALLQQVFRVGLSLSRAPAPGLPFLLPQQHRRAPSA
ncbi:MAG: heme ABC transporter ATP-binding protein [Bosea sp.]|uniref:heme ABC transporter ATP-binding protein n=1 Tax=unclassified Bosea (in: a-proteobacteria) TaxID=2653178 RepID=UPI00095CE102|nr:MULTISPECIES: heme ABC transporter ATP-binding protein [unclassified Bosea (in: a-proteobacteria)]MBN9444501.1 heme ABC transporter ATP-binding protein [Bosea sp. (in: a-proteobacteria)]MBN9455752.1 heme ABC transporter ATP-binding protein [Bosea sp. (in: a-proteobacteria)]OJV07977.1 MAG: iron ABC transporter [Bosea sp. 67-29]